MIGDETSSASIYTLSEKFEEAFQTAFKLHRRQNRKSTTVPYIAHLMSVSALVLEFGGNETEAIAALLHDAVEDQGGMPVLVDIEKRFGKKVADIVLGCSDSSGLPKPPWEQRKKNYIEHLQTAGKSVLLVSLADKLHNLKDILMTYRRIGEQTWERFTGGRAGTLWYYGELVEIFSQVGQPDLAAEFGRTYETVLRLSEGNE